LNTQQALELAFLVAEMAGQLNPVAPQGNLSYDEHLGWVPWTG